MPDHPEATAILAIYGTAWLDMTKQLLRASGMANEVSATTRIAIKPNLVVSRPASGGATTHPEVVAGIIEFLQEVGCKNISVIEGSWVGDDTKRAFAACGYTDLAARYGIPLHDLKRDRTVPVKTPAGTIHICSLSLEADYLINVPVLKGHCQTRMTSALKNLKGCISDSEKRRFHREGLDSLIAGLATALKPQMTIVDGICGDLDFEEGGNPVAANRLFLGRDPFSLDRLGCRLLGFDPREVGYLVHASEWGLGNIDQADEVQELNRPGPGVVPTSTSQVARLGKGIEADQACSACYANLIHALKRMEEKGENRALPKLCIGQGWKSKPTKHFGIGSCCCNAARHLPGCPPTATAIMKSLEELNI